MTTVKIRCHDCAHYEGKKGGNDGPSCRAFKVIPLKILNNQHDHAKPYKGDKGIRFEPIKAKAKRS